MCSAEFKRIDEIRPGVTLQWYDVSITPSTIHFGDVVHADGRITTRIIRALMSIDVRASKLALRESGLMAFHHHRRERRIAARVGLDQI